MRDPVQSETTHRGRLFSVEVLSFTDEHGRDVRREIVRHPGAVVVVPVLDDGRLVLIRNYRIAVDDRLWELPAGKLEAGEDPQHAAARELEEETGYRPGRIRPLGAFYSSPGFADEKLHAFIAEKLAFVGQNLEPGEQIEAEPLPCVEVLAMIADGRICDGKTIAAVLMWNQLAGNAP
ncbi:MAG: NUDIX hydrolase [Planctomycetota bacterium]|nr:NUDIX hydrolase [Planctomycetota bacterium]